MTTLKEREIHSYLGLKLFGKKIFGYELFENLYSSQGKLVSCGYAVQLFGKDIAYTRQESYMSAPKWLQLIINVCPPFEGVDRQKEEKEEKISQQGLKK